MKLKLRRLVLCAQGHTACELQGWNLESSPSDSKVHVLAATAWAQRLAAEREGCQSSLLTVGFCDAHFCGSTCKWHKNSIWWIRAQGDQILLDSSVICCFLQDKTSWSYFFCSLPWGWQAVEVSVWTKVHRVYISDSTHLNSNTDSTTSRLWL